MAYANSIDLHQGYPLGSRKAWMDAGHDEYWTRAMWDNLVAARDKGLYRMEGKEYIVADGDVLLFKFNV